MVVCHHRSRCYRRSDGWVEHHKRWKYWHLHDKYFDHFLVFLNDEFVLDDDDNYFDDYFDDDRSPED